MHAAKILSVKALHCKKFEVGKAYFNYNSIKITLKTMITIALI
jgi:hypothetical protein